MTHVAQGAATGAAQQLKWITSSGKVSEAIKLPSGKPLTVRLDLDLGAAPRSSSAATYHA